MLWGLAAERVRLKLALTVDPAFTSVTVTLLMEMVGPSSSVMVAVTCWVPDSVPLVTLEISTTMVSSTSSSESWTAVSVIEPVVALGGITIDIPERV